MPRLGSPTALCLCPTSFCPMQYAKTMPQQRLARPSKHLLLLRNENKCPLINCLPMPCDIASRNRTPIISALQNLPPNILFCPRSSWLHCLLLPVPMPISAQGRLHEWQAVSYMKQVST